jgi:ribose-phosphate pyrophosphokinase
MSTDHETRTSDMDSATETSVEKVSTKRFALYTGRTHPALAAEVAGHLGIQLGDANLTEFANGEIRPRFSESVRGADVFIMQTHYGWDGRSVNDSIMEQLIMIDAAYRASAKRITAVCPFYGYARQDRKAEGREPITARLIADLFLAAGAKRMVSIDLHSGQIQGFFDGPVDHLTAMPVIEEYLKSRATDPVIVSPDAGRIKVAERLAQHLGADLAFVYKRRPKGMTNVAQALDVIGDVEGRQCILTDDMIDTGGTIVSAAELLLDRGATEVWAMATHGVLSGPAVERLEKSRIARVVLTNTLPLAPEKHIDKIEVLSVAEIIAEALSAVFDDASVSEIFGGENQA